MTGTYITDSNRTIELLMTIWDGAQFVPDMTEEVCGLGGCPADPDTGAYAVHTVDYFIELSREWKAEDGNRVALYWDVELVELPEEEWP